MTRQAGLQSIELRIPPAGLAATLCIPDRAQGLILFVHGSGSSRLSPRNRMVAEALQERGFATLLFDLLTAEEGENRGNVFDVDLLATRLVDVVTWLDADPAIAQLPLGLFGASTGAAAALVAAVRLGGKVGAIVSRGGRPDLAGDALAQTHAPTLLIVGGADAGVIECNEQALARLRGPKDLAIVPGATHLFPEPGALDAVVDHAARWFARHLAAPAATPGLGTRLR